MNWTRALVTDQLGFYWDTSLWPRLQGLTDEEYLWEPVPDCWSVRPGPDGTPAIEGMDQRPPDPPPFTTLAWRILHVAVGVFYTRASTFFGDGSVPAGADMFDVRHRPAELPGTAAGALDLLQRSYHWWTAGVLAMSDDEFLQPLGPRASYFGEQSMAQLVLHLNRETMHHGGEIGALRDLYRATGGAQWRASVRPGAGAAAGSGSG